MRQFSNTLRRSPVVFPRAVVPLSNRHRLYSTATQPQQARPKIHDAAGKFEGNPEEVEEHNRQFDSTGTNKSTAPKPKIHNTAGVFEGEERDVLEHNRAFKERVVEGPTTGRYGKSDSRANRVFGLEERDVMEHNREVSERRGL
ncbi:hypothetical protein H072_5910 [Dactylellina haptotyla CBS 200.50]|uniref:Uncharacterized protein n=1 Tax=Dactylellina haptotyla (strain CBS 200.50) TaxID=1284197 RepID=S8ABI6_DACHA|nr:hypothetical protein H072_5910 [Dactylellina haptotyla CBS 200.50]